MRYELHWLNHQGVRKGIFQGLNRLEFVKSQNAIGSLVADIPRGLLRYDQFAKDDILEVWREKGGTTRLMNETAYFLQNWGFWTDGDGQELLRLTAFDANRLLDTAIVWAKAGSAEADKSGDPANMMKAIVREQLGSLAAAERRKLAVAPDGGAYGSSITKAFAYRNVLTVLQEICETASEGGNWLGFDVVRTAPGEFEFRTYAGQRGQNHGRFSGDPRLVGKQYGNFSQAAFETVHADERNVVLVAGQGEEADRAWAVRINEARATASKWSRSEYFKDSRDDDSTAALEADGDAALNEFRPKQILTGNLNDTPGMQFGIHYQFGDILAAEAFGFNLDCRVDAVRVVADQENGEQIECKLRGEM